MSSGRAGSASGVPITLIKWGGSLITDKSRPETDRPEVLQRLARELARALEERAELAGRLVLGHGSGSFGHVAAARYRVHRGRLPTHRGEMGDASGEQPPSREEQLLGVSITQRRAAELHRRVLEALAEGGVATFSIAPSSALVTRAGEPVAFEVEPLVRALEAGLLPVTYGDVVMDRHQGFAICSTEGVFAALVEELAQGKGARSAGGELPVGRILWLGETAGVWGEEGETLPQITPATAGEILESVGGSAGTDVTGGMLHRVESAVELARRGVSSFIGDGREEGLLTRLLAVPDLPETRRGEIPGTWVRPE